MFILHLLIIQALSNVLYDVPVHPAPLIVMLKVIIHLGNSGVYRVPQTVSL